jgi:hypothetical protein
MSMTMAVNPSSVWQQVHTQGRLPGDVARGLRVHPSVVFAALAEHRAVADADDIAKMRRAGENHWATDLPSREDVQRQRAAHLLKMGEDYDVIRERLGIHHSVLERMPEYVARRRADVVERAALDAVLFRMSYDEGLGRDAVCTTSGLHVEAVMSALRREWKRRNGTRAFASPFPAGGWRARSKALRGQSALGVEAATQQMAA